jgi:hypothetical protein
MKGMTIEDLKRMIAAGAVKPFSPKGCREFVAISTRSSWYILTAAWSLIAVPKRERAVHIRRGEAALEVWSDKLAYLHCVKEDLDFFLKPEGDDDEWEDDDE